MKRVIFIASILLLAVVPMAYSDCSTLTFLTESVPQFTVGHSAHTSIEAIGGAAPYSYAIISGTLPAGLHMTSSGNIRGVPTEEADTTIFVTVTDANGCQLTSAYAIRVAP